jgi:hypothetical protein
LLYDDVTMYSSSVVVDLYICDCDVFVYSVFVFYFNMTCFISSCPVTDLGSKKYIYIYIYMYVCTV